MKKALTKKEVIRKIADKVEMPASQVEKILEVAQAVHISELKAAGEVKTVSGKIKIVNCKAREARNPQTGAKIRIPARKKPKFSFSKEFKENF